MRLNVIGGERPGSVIRVKGLTQVMTRLNEEVQGIQGRSLEGLISAVAKIHKETETGAVRVPVDLGNLRHSWFYVTSKGKIIVGGSVEHAVTEATGKFVGKNAAKLYAGHESLKGEMKSKANILSKMYYGPFVICGYSANYALWVHEMTTANFGNKKKGKRKGRRGSGPKWFQYAIEKNYGEILETIRKNAKVK